MNISVRNKIPFYINLTRITTLISIIFVMFAKPQRVSACSCVMSGGPNTEFSQSNAVFTGTVTKITNKQVPIISLIERTFRRISFSSMFLYTYAQRFYGNEVTFTVIKSWKHIDNISIEISSNYGGSDCGYSFVAGNDYLVYANHAYGKPGNYLVTSICSRTIELSGATDDLAFLNKLPTIPLSPTIQIPWEIISGAIFLVLFLFIAIFLYQKRRKKISIAE